MHTSAGKYAGARRAVEQLWMHGAHMHTFTHAYMHTCTHARMHTCTHEHINIIGFYSREGCLRYIAACGCIWLYMAVYGIREGIPIALHRGIPTSLYRPGG